MLLVTSKETSLEVNAPTAAPSHNRRVGSKSLNVCRFQIFEKNPYKLIIAFKKKLMTDCAERMPATILSRDFCLPIGCPKI